jgi:hypothetical protein
MFEAVKSPTKSKFPAPSAFTVNFFAVSANPACPAKFPLNELVIELALIEPVTCKSFVVAKNEPVCLKIPLSPDPVSMIKSNEFPFPFSKVIVFRLTDAVSKFLNDKEEVVANEAVPWKSEADIKLLALIFKASIVFTLIFIPLTNPAAELA